MNYSDLKTLRAKWFLTPTEHAHLLGVSTSTYFSWSSNKADPDPPLNFWIMQACRCHQILTSRQRAHLIKVARETLKIKAMNEKDEERKKETQKKLI